MNCAPLTEMGGVVFFDDDVGIIKKSPCPALTRESNCAMMAGLSWEICGGLMSRSSREKYVIAAGLLIGYAHVEVCCILLRLDMQATVSLNRETVHVQCV